MPPVVESPQVAMPPLCFCGQEASQGSIYCSPFCAREDAFNSLTLGKPHECSNPAMAPLPTLPPGFFDLPPKRSKVSLSLHDPDEFDFGFDQGPFQQTKAKTKAVKSKPKPKSSTKVPPRSSAYVTEQIGGNSKPVPRPSKQPRTRRPAAPADTDNTVPRKRSKWRSHYQKAQEETAASLEVPWLFVDSPAGEEEKEELGKADDKELITSPAKTADNLELLMPTPLSPQRENGLSRPGSFGPMPIKTNSTLISAISKKDTTITTAADGTAGGGGREAAFHKGHARREYSRSSSSSGNSGLTSGTSRTSYTSLAGTSDVSITKSEFPPPPLPRSSLTITTTCNSEVRPGYGSAFGSVEDKPQLSPSQSITTASIAPIVQQLAADLQATILQARRESQTRRRSRTLALPGEKSSTTMNFVKRSSRQSFYKQKPASTPPAAVDDPMDVIDISAPVKKATTTTEPAKRKMGGTPVSRSKWTQMRTPTSPCAERAPSTIIPAVPSMPLSRPLLAPMSSSSATNTTTSTEMSAPTPHSVAGTVVKKTTVVNNSRLPIGSGLLSFKTPPMPSSSLSPSTITTSAAAAAKQPSNTPSSAFHVSLQSKSYRAPAYAMSVPKIPASTRTLHTSPSNRSLKSKKSEGHIRIPSVNDEERTSLFERLKSSLDLPLPSQQQQQQQQKVSMESREEEDMGPRNLRPTLKLDPLEASRSSDNLTLAMTPRVTSPWSDRTSSTSGGPNTPRPSADTASSQPFWMASSSSPLVAGSMPFLEQDPMLMSGRTVRLGSDASTNTTTASEMSYSASTPDGLGSAAASDVAQRMKIRRSRSEAALNIFKLSSR